MTKETETFSLTEIARELKLDAKFARRKIRANAAKAKDGVKLPPEVKSPAKKNSRWIWPNTAANRKAVTDFLKG